MAEERMILDGIKVLDVGTWVFGPASATVMSDYGAEVIKIENPGMGDPYRYLYQMAPMPASDQNYCWMLDGRNKRSVALNLKNDEAREALYRLCKDADVFITNYPPAVLATLGIAYEDIKPLKEDIIYAQVTGYGEKGPEANKPGYDATAYWARSSLMDVVRSHGSDPSLSAAGMGDHPSAMALFGGIMLALYERQRTGKGTKVSSSLIANGAWAQGCLLQGALCGAEPFENVNRLEPMNALVNTYRTKDDRWFLLALTQEDRDWPKLAEAIGRPGLADDARFAQKPERHANAPELAAILDGVFTSKDYEEWSQALDEKNLTFGVVAQLDDVPNDPQMALNDIFVEIDNAPVQGQRTINSPIWLSGHTKVKPRLAPELGEHTDEVLESLGYDRETIGRLRDSKAIG